MVTTTIRKWGNSQGVLLPKAILHSAGLDAGSVLSLETAEGVVVLRAVREKKDRKYPNIDSLFAEWDEEYTPPEDYSTQGAEIDTGDSVGVEMW